RSTGTAVRRSADRKGAARRRQRSVLSQAALWILGRVALRHGAGRPLPRRQDPEPRRPAEDLPRSGTGQVETEGRLVAATAYGRAGGVRPRGRPPSVRAARSTSRGASAEGPGGLGRGGVCGTGGGRVPR